MSGNRIKLIGLTGNIGSGKSTVSARLSAAHGFYVLDADAISHALFEPGEACCKRVAACFGNAILHKNGSVNRKALSAIVFADKEKLQQLNSIVHPAVLERMLQHTGRVLQDDSAAVAVWDVPLLYESGMDAYPDRNILVYADDAVRLQRIIQRDGCTREAAQARMDAQQSQDAKRLLADAVLDNSSTLESLYRQVDALAVRIRSGMM